MTFFSAEIPLLLLLVVRERVLRGVADVFAPVLEDPRRLLERLEVEQTPRGGVLVRRVLGLVEAERVPEDDVEGGRVVPVAARVPVLGLLVVLAAAGLGTWE